MESGRQSGNAGTGGGYGGIAWPALGVLLAILLGILHAMVRDPMAVRAGGSAVPAAGVSPADRQLPAQVVHGTPPARSAAIPATAAQAPQTSLPQNFLSDGMLQTMRGQLSAAQGELQRSRDDLNEAAGALQRTRTAGAILLAAFALIAAFLVTQVYRRSRAWERRALKSIEQVEAIAAHLEPLHDAQREVRRMLPKLLQEVGEQPLSFQEQGSQFSPEAFRVLEDIDHLAYVGGARLFFDGFQASPEAAVYLNGLLLSAAAHLARTDPWTAFARLDQFVEMLARYPEAVERRRIAQAYSYRALAAYQALAAQDGEPSWLRKAERPQNDVLSKQAFADLAQAGGADPEWKHTAFVEALLCSRFYAPTEPAESASRSDLMVRGLRRAVFLYKGLIEQRSYRGPARHQLARCLRRIAEQTGDKSDFSDFGYTLSSFPSDEELADEALAARAPMSQDRFLWQWMLGDEEMFRSVEKLNLAEYRAFWIRLLDNKVHLRNWRADLGELQQKQPAMKEWSVQLLHAEAPISLANAISRRQERFDTSSSGT